MIFSNREQQSNKIIHIKNAKYKHLNKPNYSTNSIKIK